MAMDLTGPGYQVSRSNLLVLESKADMQNRGQASPDGRAGADLRAWGGAGGSGGGRRGGCNRRVAINGQEHANNGNARSGHAVHMSSPGTVCIMGCRPRAENSQHAASPTPVSDQNGRRAPRFAQMALHLP
jgi:hypothetical protein